MTRPTIEEFKKAIEEMREVYPFKDDNTEIHLGEDMRTGCASIHLRTRDNRSDVDIQLSKLINSKHPYLDLKKGE